MSAVITQLMYGPDCTIRYLADGSLHFDPSPIAGQQQKVAINGFLDIGGIAQPAVSLAGGARLYMDSTTEQLFLSLNGGAYFAFATGATFTSISNDGGSVTVNADGSITLVSAGAGILSTGPIALQGSTTISTSSGNLTLSPAGTLIVNPGATPASQVTFGVGTITGAGALTLAATSGNLTLNTTTAGNINLGAAGNITITATGGSVTFPPGETLVGGAGTASNLSLAGSSRVSAANSSGDLLLNTLAGTPTFQRGRVGIGVAATGFTSSADQLHIQGVDSASAAITIDVYSTASNSPMITARRAEGTVGTPATVNNGDNLLQIVCEPYNSANFLANPNAAINFVALETYTAGANGSSIRFATTATGTTTLTSQMIIDSQAGVTLAIPLAPASGGAAASAAGISAIVLPGYPVDSSGTVAANGTNTVQVFQVLIPALITVVGAVFSVITGVAASLGSFALYTLNGNTKVLDTGAKSTANSVTAVNVTGLNVTINPGWYWLAWTCTSSTVTYSGFNFAGAAGGAIHQSGNTLMGTAANASASGVMPATLGTITRSATAVITAALLMLDA